MKKSLLALAALGAFAGAAHAQSSVTLYGIVDEGINYNSNAGGHRLYNLSSGVLQGSRWGLRGAEDLGGGLKAIFTIENGFDVNTGRLGQGGLEFGRQAFVGLSGPYGTLTLGRQYDSVVDFVGPLESADQWGGYISAHPGDLDNFNNTNRVNNGIKFTSANYAGFTFGGLYSLGGVSGNFSRNQIYSVGAGYANGPLTLGAGYLNVKNPNTSFYGDGGTVAATTGGIPGSNMGGSPVYAGFASARSLQIIGAGGAFSFGPATIGATYSNTKFKSIGDTSSGPLLGTVGSPLSGTATFNNAEINFKYHLTPALLLGVAYDYTKGSFGSGVKYHQGQVGADYFLSKRTDVYVVGVFQKASGTDSTGQSAVAAINGLTPSSTNRQATVRLGIRHKF